MFKDSTVRLVRLPRHTDSFLYLGAEYMSSIRSLKKGAVHQKQKKAHTQISHICWTTNSVLRLWLHRDLFSLDIQRHYMVRRGRLWNIQVWHLEYQQHGWWCLLHWMPVCLHSWEVPENDHGRTFSDENTKLPRDFIPELFVPDWNSSQSSCSAKRLMRLQWTEERCTQLESVVWFLLWWNSMMKPNAVDLEVINLLFTLFVLCNCRLNKWQHYVHFLSLYWEVSWKAVWLFVKIIAILWSLSDLIKHWMI